MNQEIIKRTMLGLGVTALCAAAQTATAQQPCSACDGPDWISGCGAGTDEMDSGAEVGIYANDVCSDEITSLVLRGPVTVVREAESGGTINTEITNMVLTSGGVILTVGAGLGQGGVLAPTLGTITATGDPDVGDSAFNVFFEFDGAGIGTVYNQAPLLIQADITCVPPQARYLHPEGQCIPLWSDVAGGTIVAYLGDAVHETFPPSGVPAVSEWGLIVLTLLALTIGTVMLARQRQHAAA